jgi:hypothetical protein
MATWRTWQSNRVKFWALLDSSEQLELARISLRSEPGACYRLSVRGDQGAGWVSFGSLKVAKRCGERHAANVSALYDAECDRAASADETCPDVADGDDGKAVG